MLLQLFKKIFEAQQPENESFTVKMIPGSDTLNLDMRINGALVPLYQIKVLETLPDGRVVLEGCPRRFD
jgi:hypothetical protein